MNIQNQDFPHQPYTRIVSGSQTAVLFLHGILGTPDHFQALIPLVPDNWSIFNILLDGHGKGVSDFSHTSMKKWEAQTSEVLSSLCQTYESIIIVGHSMGTLFAIDGALAHPSKIKGLILLACHLYIRLRPSAARNSLHVMFDKIPKDDPVLRSARAACSIQMEKNPLKYIGWFPRYVELFHKIHSIRKQLHALSLPCFAFQSGNDELVSGRACALLESNPRIKTYLLKTSRHFYYSETDSDFLKEKFKTICQTEFQALV